MTSKPSPAVAPARLGMQVRIGDLTLREPVVVPRGTPIAAALERMAEHQIGSIIIVDAARRPVGIFTLRDLLTRVSLPGLDTARPIDSVMSQHPICADASLSAHKASLLMAREQLRHLLITDAAGVLAGIVSRTDIYDLLCKACISVRNASPGEAIVVAPGAPEPRPR